jgi:Sec-independent protein translocase protein TatA
MIKRQEDVRSVFFTAAVAMVLVAVVLIITFFRKRLPGLA